jgi:hypothetical protein
MLACSLACAGQTAKAQWESSHDKDPMDDSVTDYLMVSGEVLSGHASIARFLLTCKGDVLKGMVTSDVILKTNGHNTSAKVRFDDANAVDRDNWFGSPQSPKALMIDNENEALKIAASMLHAKKFLIQLTDYQGFSSVLMFEVSGFAGQMKELRSCQESILAAEPYFVSLSRLDSDARKTHETIPK